MLPSRKRTQGGASLCPGLSPFAPLGRTDRSQPPPGLPLDFPWQPSGDFLPFGQLWRAAFSLWILYNLWTGRYSRLDVQRFSHHL